MGAFTDVYRRHHDLYGRDVYHPTEAEVVRYRKLFNFGIDQGLSDEEKIKGVSNAIIKTALPFKEAMQLFFQINGELYKQNNFILRIGCPHLCSALEAMKVRHIQGYSSDYKIGTNKLKDLVNKDFQTTSTDLLLPEDRRPKIIAAYRAGANMRVDRPSLTVRQREEEAKRGKTLYLLCNELSGGTEQLERELMSFDDAVNKWAACFER